MKIICFLLSTFISVGAFAQTEIKMGEINKHVGDSVKICTKIYGGIYLDRSKETLTLINAGGNYPNSPLTLVISPELRKEYETAPEEMYKDKQVCIIGKVELFKEKPQIKILSKSQIVLTQ
jgi:hypothetical protein